MGGFEASGGSSYERERLRRYNIVESNWNWK